MGEVRDQGFVLHTLPLGSSYRKVAKALERLKWEPKHRVMSLRGGLDAYLFLKKALKALRTREMSGAVVFSTEW